MTTRRDFLRALTDTAVLAFMPATVERIFQEDPWVEFERNYSAAAEKLRKALLHDAWTFTFYDGWMFSNPHGSGNTRISYESVS